MELNREEIIKALECCTYGGDVTKSQVEVCLPCPYFHEGNCTDVLKENALSLINELTEEKNRLTLELSAIYDRRESTRENDIIETLMLRQKVDELTEENEKLNKLLEHCEDEGEYWEGKYNNAVSDTVSEIFEEIEEILLDYPDVIVGKGSRFAELKKKYTEDKQIKEDGKND